LILKNQTLEVINNISKKIILQFRATTQIIEQTGKNMTKITLSQKILLCNINLKAKKAYITKECNAFSLAYSKILEKVIKIR
jgi:sulfite reductase beta subunit-like hemoprotein